MRSFKDFFYSFRREIVVGIITTLFIELIRILIKITPEGAQNLFDAFINLKYYLASGISMSYICSFLLSLIFSGILGMLIAIIIILFRTLISKKKKTEKLGKSQETKDIEELKKEIEKNELEINKSLMNLKRIFNFFKIFTVVYLLIVVSLFIVLLSSLKIKQQFDLDMKEIKPYIEQKKFDLLNSDWVQMKNKEDYKKIYQSVDEVIKENELKHLKYHIYNR